MREAVTPEVVRGRRRARTPAWVFPIGRKPEQLTGATEPGSRKEGTGQWLLERIIAQGGVR
jgi:hypothetical protein